MGGSASFGMRVRQGNVSLGGVSTQAVNPSSIIPISNDVAQRGVSTQNNTNTQDQIQENDNTTISSIPNVSSTRGLTLSERVERQSTTSPFVNERGITNRDLSLSNIQTNRNPFPLIDPTNFLKPRKSKTPKFNVEPSVIVKISEPFSTTPDTLRVSEKTTENDHFEQVPRSGICNQRPEIISLIDFNQVFKPENTSEFTDNGKLLSVNFQIRLIREQTLFKLINNIINGHDDTLKTAINQSINQQKTKLDEVQKLLHTFELNIQSINQIKSAFDIKLIPNSSYKTKEFLTLKDFFQAQMLFSEDAYKSFSDTKVLFQLLFDFRACLEAYSVNLLNLFDVDRVNDHNPILLDKTYTRTDGFTFSVDAIKSTGPILKKAFISSEFTPFLNSLPSNYEQRLKILLHVLNKELRVSRGLSKKETRKTISTFYQGNPDGNPFDNIIGEIGNDIFDRVKGTNSLAELFQFIGPDNTTVLPFEQKTVDDGQTTFVPGTKYFADSILTLTTDNKFNTGPFNLYSQKYSDNLSQARNVINSLFEFTNSQFRLAPKEFFQDFAKSLELSLDSVADVSKQQNKDQVICSALFHLGNKDFNLKLMLFQYLLLLGIASSQNNNRKKIFDRLIDEVGNLRSFSFIRINQTANPNLKGGLAQLRPYLEQLALDIQTKVFNLVNPERNTREAQSNILSTDRAERNLTRAATDFSIVTDDSARTVGANNFLTAPRSSTSSVSAGTKGAARQIKGISLETDTIKNTLLGAITTNSLAGDNLIKEFIDFAVKIDNAASIQGNEITYTVSNGTTRYNFISTSYILLILFECFSSFIEKYISVEFVKVEKTGTIAINFNDEQNNAVLNYLKEAISEQRVSKKVSGLSVPVIPHASVLLKSNIFSKVNTQKNNTQSLSEFDIAERISNDLLGNIVSQVNQTESQQIQDSNAGTALSGLLATNSPKRSIDQKKRPGQKIGFSGAITSNFYSPRNASTESVKNLFKTAAGPLSGFIKGNKIDNIDSTSKNSLDSFFLRKFGALKDSIISVRNKIEEEDNILQNFLHLFEVFGDRLSLVSTKVSSYFTALSKNQEVMNSLLLYKDNLIRSHLKTSEYIFNREKETLDDAQYFGAISSIKRDEYFSLLSFLKQPVYTDLLANSRVKIIAVGIPTGFSDKLIDRIERTDINPNNFKEQESDVVSINVYKKSAEDQDIVFYPQKFIFDLSLYSNSFKKLDLDANLPFDRLIPQVALLDFENGKKEITNLDRLSVNEKYNFLNADEKFDLFKNHISDQLLHLYVYLTSGLSLYEDIFPETPYVNLSLSTRVLPPSMEQFLRIYFNSKMEFEYPSNVSILNAITDPSLPDHIKDDIQLFAYGTNFIKQDLIVEKILNRKKFERILLVPINIDSFVINKEVTKQTTSGKKAFSKQSFQKKLGVRKVTDHTDNELFYIDRANIKNALIFEDYFVTVETVRKA